MSQSEPSFAWQTHECVPWVKYQRRSLDTSSFEVIDDREPEPPVFIVPDLDGVHRFAADHSRTKEFVPVGDFIAWLTGILGIPKCGPCAKRQACLNRLLGRP